MTIIAYNTRNKEVVYRFSPGATNEDFDAACERVKNPVVEEVAELPDAELIRVYNLLTGENVTKFPDRDTGVERVEAALDKSEIPTWENTTTKETTMKKVAPKKVEPKKVEPKKAAPKKEKAATGERKRWGGAEFIRGELIAGATDVDKIIDDTKVKFPKVSATRGYVRWLARGLGLADQVPSTRGRPAADKLAGVKAPAKKATVKKATVKKAAVKKAAVKKVTPKK